jgi:hypothetical protein
MSMAAGPTGQVRYRTGYIRKVTLALGRLRVAGQRLGVGGACELSRHAIRDPYTAAI